MLEKDHLLQKKNEATENVERLEKKKETLLRENEKLKNDIKQRPAGRPGNALPPTMKSGLGTAFKTRFGSASR
jgi:hypothetical protein